MNKYSSTFFDHLEELRQRLFVSLGAWFAASVIFFYFTDAVLAFLVAPIGHLVYTAPAEAFTAHLLLTFLGGFFVALPVILYEVWAFTASGLTEQERKYIRVFGPASFVLFLLGACFSYWILVPISLKFLLSFSTEEIAAMITVYKYISFVGTFVVAGGMVFELPLILLFLAKIGVATPEFLRQKRPYAIVGIFILSAIITPPDVVSQILMGLPLILLYEVGLLAVKWAYKEK